MATQCTSDAFPLAGLGRRQVVAKFDGGRLSSDGGAVLLRAANQAFQVTGRLAACFIDHRNPARVEHSLESLLGQRVFALALGYEDINDHDRLRDDSLLALALDGPDLTGQSRRRERDRGHALAGSSTLNRLELGALLEADEDRYKKVVASTEQIDDLLVDLFLDMHETLPERIVLDVDATDDQLHGQQEGRFYHGYYRHYCYLPLYITCGEHVLCARLRTAQAEAAEGTVAELERIVRRIRQRWPQAAIVVRGDAGFCRDTLMTWCEQRGVDYVLGLARNSRLLGQIRRQLQQAGKACARTGQAARRFRDFRYRTLQSWGRQRRVVGKAEWLPGQRGANPRFVVTSLSREEVAGRQLYEELYCARGEMENRIKEQQLDLFADRTSTATMRANQLRMYFSVFAGTLLLIMRRYGLAGTPLARAQSGTIRSRILKVAVAVRVTARKVWLRFSSTYPHRELFERIARLLTDRRPRACPG